MADLNRTTHISFPEIPGYSDITTGIASGSLSLDEILLTGNLNFGEVNSNKFEVQIYGISDVANKIINVWVDDEYGDTVQIFHGIVDSCKQDNMGYYRQIVAYDELYYKGSLNIANWWTSYWSNRTSSTLLELRTSLCNFVNISESSDVGTLFNDDLVVYKAVSLTSLSFRDLLKMICEMQCVIPTMHREGGWFYVDLSNIASHSITGLYKSGDSEFEDFVTQKIDGITIYGADSAIAGTTDPTNIAKNVYNISGNIIAYGVEDGTVNQLATAMLAKVGNIQYTPAKVEMIVSDIWVWLGDKLATEKGSFFVFKQQLSGVQFIEQTVEASGDEYLAGMKTTYNADITALRSQVETLTDDVLANALVSYQAVNVNQPFTITNTWVKVIDFWKFNVITTEITDLIFMGNLNLRTFSREYFDEDNNTYEYTPATVEVRYVLNGGIIDYHPKQEYDDGLQILPLNHNFFPKFEKKQVHIL